MSLFVERKTVFVEPRGDFGQEVGCDKAIKRFARKEKWTEVLESIS